MNHLLKAMIFNYKEIINFQSDENQTIRLKWPWVCVFGPDCPTLQLRFNQSLNFVLKTKDTRYCFILKVLKTKSLIKVNFKQNWLTNLPFERRWMDYNLSMIYSGTIILNKYYPNSSLAANQCDGSDLTISWNFHLIHIFLKKSK